MPRAASASRASTCCLPTSSPARPPAPAPSASAPSKSARARASPRTVARVERLGDQTRLHLRFRDHALVTVTEPHTPLRPGDTVRIEPRNPFYFDASGARLTQERAS